MLRASLPLAFAATLAVAAPSARDSEVLIFEDTFDTLNLSMWKHEITLSGGGNWEFEGYTNNRSISRVVNGSLIITPKPLSDAIGMNNVINGYDMGIWGGDPGTLCTSNFEWGCERSSGAGGNALNPVQSAKLRTAETFAFTYGRVEVSARLPRGDWMWPAIWMMPVESAYGTWPVSGEIDIMESRGNARGYPAGGCEAFGSTLHFGPYEATDGAAKAHASYTVPTGDLTTAFHTYGLVWNATHMLTYIDSEDQVVLSLDLSNFTSFWNLGGWATSTPGVDNPWELGGGGPNAPFDRRFYLILEVAVGGTNGYFPDGEGGKPWTDTSAHASTDFVNAQSTWWPGWQAGSPMMIDSVRVWQTPGGDFAQRPML